MQPLKSKKIISLLQHLTDGLGECWKRRRKQGPKTVFLTLLITALGPGKISIRRALTLLSEIFPGSSPRKEPTDAAFCMMRHKLTEQDMRQIFRPANVLISKDKTPSGMTINGHQIVAIDGSQLVTPRSESTLNEFGVYETRNNSHQPQSRLIAAWNVSKRRPINWQVGTCYESERHSAVNMIPSLPKKSLVILDRGFFGVNTLRSFKNAKIPCFMRIRTGRSTWMPVQEFLKTKGQEKLITISDADGDSLKCRVIKKIIYNKKKKSYTTYAFVTTLLDKKKWPAKALVDSYRYRWDIETSFREAKILDNLESFNGHTAMAVRQEVAAYMIARLLTSYVWLIARNTQYKSLQADQMNINDSTFNHVTIVELIYDCILSIHGPRLNDPLAICEHRYGIVLKFRQKKRPKREYEYKCKGRYGRWKGTKNHRRS